MLLFYIESDQGCGIRAAKNITQAMTEAKKECGTYNFKFVRHATHDDIDHVSMMGGYIPEGRVKRIL